jgi:hypothetical protein
MAEHWILGMRPGNAKEKPWRLGQFGRDCVGGFRSGGGQEAFGERPQRASFDFSLAQTMRRTN